jgi:sec-independent protein translocase protein TatA
MFEGLFQPMHLLVIFVIAVLVFGPKRLPELGKGLGDGIRALKEGLRDDSAKTATPASTSTTATSTTTDETNKSAKV